VSEQVVLAWADPGDVSGRFMDSVMRVMYASEQQVAKGVRESFIVAGHARVESGPRIGAARNQLVRMFLSKDEWKDVEWMLMLDADMTFGEDLLYTLLHDVRNDDGSLKRAVVGGLCFGGGHGAIWPTMYSIVDPEENGGNAVNIISDFTEGEIVKVDATGAACLLIHRRVLEYMATIYEEPTPWFVESIYKGQEFGEDWTFCARLRSHGIEIFVNTAAKIGHLKSILMDEKMWRTGDVGLVSPAPPKEQIKKASGVVISATDETTHLNREQRRSRSRQRVA
jgi:hypothetical protein